MAQISPGCVDKTYIFFYKHSTYPCKLRMSAHYLCNPHKLCLSNGALVCLSLMYAKWYILTWQFGSICFFVFFFLYLPNYIFIPTELKCLYKLLEKLILNFNIMIFLMSYCDIEAQCRINLLLMISWSCYSTQWPFRGTFFPACFSWANPLHLAEPRQLKH